MLRAGTLRVQPGTPVDTALSRLAETLASLHGWPRYGLAVLLGALMAAAMPPVDLSPVVFISLPGLVWLDDGSEGGWSSFRLGYAFGMGFFIAGFYWMTAALFVDIAQFWWALPLALLGVPAILSFFTGVPMALLGLATRRFGLAGTARACLFAVLWCAGEWARGHVLTGLPWNLVGYAWSGGFPGALALLQVTAWTGIYGLSFVTTLAAATLALLGVPRRWPPSLRSTFGPVVAAAAILLLPAGFGALRLSKSPTRLGDTVLRLVQPSIPQSLKWDQTAGEENFHRLLELSGTGGDRPPAAVIWPEGAATFYLERDAKHRGEAAKVAPQGGYLITGAIRADTAAGQPTRYYNSIEAIDGKGDIRATYDKSHLVPFGEYMPLRRLLPISDFIAGATDLSAGPGPRTISLPGLPPFAAAVCYEAIFPHAVVDESNRPAWILNVTNDAWYGRTSGPYQHFAIARTRAVEEGLPLVRVGNNGISGVIDPEGRVVAHTTLDAIGYADVTLPDPRGRTLYARAGDGVFAILLLLGLVPALWQARRRLR
ncbi:MAG TPA: apolipoprotein N-acyltransferase [Stellaceae bacterium]